MSSPRSIAASLAAALSPLPEGFDAPRNDSSAKRSSTRTRFQPVQKNYTTVLTTPVVSSKRSICPPPAPRRMGK